MILLIPTLLVLFTSVHAPLPVRRPAGRQRRAARCPRAAASGRAAADPWLERDHPQGHAVRPEDLARRSMPCTSPATSTRWWPSRTAGRRWSWSRPGRPDVPAPKLIVIYSPYRRLYSPLKTAVTDLQKCPSRSRHRRDRSRAHRHPLVPCTPAQPDGHSIRSLSPDQRLPPGDRDQRSVVPEGMKGEWAKGRLRTNGSSPRNSTRPAGTL